MLLNFTVGDWALVASTACSCAWAIVYIRKYQTKKDLCNIYKDHIKDWKKEVEVQKTFIQYHNDQIFSLEEANTAKDAEIGKLQKQILDLQQTGYIRAGAINLKQKEIEKLKETIRLKDEFIAKRNIQYKNSQHAVEVMANVIDAKVVFGKNPK